MYSAAVLKITMPRMSRFLYFALNVIAYRVFDHPVSYAQVFATNLMQSIIKLHKAINGP